MNTRSYLYVPGDQVDKLAKAAERGADAIIADLEDAVAFSAKVEARRITAEWVLGQRAGRPEIWVRINNHADLMAADVAAVVGAGLTGIYIPKTAGTGTIDDVAALVDTAASDRGLDPASIKLGAMIETAAGVLAADRIAAHNRLTEVAIGEADLGAELGIRPSPDEHEWLPIRSRLVVACAAAGINPPVGPVSVDFRDLDALRSSTEALLRMGFRARPAIHPAQVPVINDVFTPTIDEINAARSLVHDYDAALREGRGVILDSRGNMVDEAAVRNARIILQGITESGERDG